MTASRSSRSRHRAHAAAAIASLALAVAAIAGLSACSAGQITQTASQVAAVPGGEASGGPGGTIQLRNVVIAYNDIKGYPAGGSAPLVVRIFNSGTTAIRLVGVRAGGVAEGVRLVGGKPSAVPSTAPATSQSGAATSSATPTATATATGTPTPPASPSTGASPSVSATATGTPGPAGEGTFSIEIPAASYVLLVPGSGPYLQLTGLTRPLSAGAVVPLVFAFADGTTIAVNVPFGQPTQAVPRGTAEHNEDVG